MPYTIVDVASSEEIPTDPNGVYYLDSGVYLITSIDDKDNSVYQNTLTVVPTAITNINDQNDTLWFYCDYPEEVEYNAPVENGIMYDMNNDVVESLGGGYYLLDAREMYTFVYADSSNCELHTRNIVFRDFPVIDESTTYMNGIYNREQHPCCFIDLTETVCEIETPLQFGQEIQVYNLGGEAPIFETNLELYGGSVLGFRFCPPHWDTTAGSIDGITYMIIIRNDECSYCRIDFLCDSVGDPEEFIILNNPTNPTDAFKWNAERANAKGIVSGSKKPEQGSIPTGISVYPNPANSEITVKVVNVNLTNLTVNISDAAGKPIYSNSFKTVNKQLTTQISLTDLASGVYSVYIPELNYYYKLVIIR